MPSQPVLTFVLTVKGAINIAFGAGLVVGPEPLLHLYGLPLDPAGALLARLLGAACFGVGLVQFFGRNFATKRPTIASRGRLRDC